MVTTDEKTLHVGCMYDRSVHWRNGTYEQRLETHLNSITSETSSLERYVIKWGL